MEFNRIQNAIDLLGQGPPPPAPPSEPKPAPRDLAGNLEPKLGIPWSGFHQGFWSSLAALFAGAPEASSLSRGQSAFRDSWVEARVPRRAVVAAALWHVAFLAAPFSLLTGLPHHNPAFQNVELTWSGPIDDLPLLEIPRAKAKPAPRADAAKPLPPLGADAFHPRQRIFTDPVRPTHARQTLINPAAPAMVPKLLPNLPNMVQFQQAAPAKPRLQISEEMLKRLRPREKRAARLKAAPAPDLPGIEPRAADLNLPAAQVAPARPKLDLNAGAAPRVAQRAQAGDATPAPDVAATQLTALNGGPTALIALSATPGPPVPVAPPQGNAAARVSISPEGKQRGVPGGTPNNSGAAASEAVSGNGAGKNSVGVSISGGNPPAAKGVSGLSANAGGPPRVLVTRPDPKAAISDDADERTGPPDFAALPPGAKPETVFAYKKIYTMNVNMPNLNSATGSWILNFSEFHAERPRTASADLSGPVPLKKVDPKYPQTLMSERVEGEVVLYAVIRRDGSVDGIQLVHGVDEQLDANAMTALGQWKFRPAVKQGSPVELEAIVHIPFRVPQLQQ
jgi:TonB family protein